jgi:MYXO-CTERM domain-containing protein
MMVRRSALVSSALAWMAISAWCLPAEACGGTFCDGGPMAMPVDQTGENILFVLDGTHVDAHIQIQYQGEPSRFAWVLPVPAVPDSIEVGSEVFFQNLLSSTVPSFGFGFCGAAGTVNGGGGVALSNGSPGVEVLFKSTVGAFDVTVLRGGTAAEVTSWLSANGYEQVSSAPTILDQYVRNNFAFVAVKLTGGAGIQAIHPLVVRYPGNTPCVPLELTAVNAVPEMRVRAFILAQDRAVPLSYQHVELNLLKLDWVKLAANYVDVVSVAVDSPLAGGHAFVTEYAGPSNVVTRTALYSASWDPSKFTALAPEQVIDELERQELVSCAAAKCTFVQPQVLPLLETYLPAPSGVDEQAFYSCLACYPTLIDRKVWDGVAFARGLLERVVLPGRRANDALDAFPYLTRLFTTISPEEMTLDPTFLVRSGMKGVDLRQQIACGSSYLTLPGGTTVRLNTDGSWPSFDDMPFATKIESFTQAGDAIVLEDNALAIDSALKTWNDPRASGVGTGGATGGANNGSGGSYGSPALGSGGANGSADSASCACAVVGNRANRNLVLGLSALLSAVFLRKRRHSAR